MNITLCVLSLTSGGAERVASLWIKGFCEMGHNVSVVLGNMQSPITYPILDKVKIYDAEIKGKSRITRYLYNKFVRARKLHSIFCQTNPDVVIAVVPDWGPLIYKAKRNLKFKVIGTDHNSYERPETAPMDQWQKYLKFEFNKKFDAVTVITQADKDYIGDKLNNVFVLPNPLAFEPVENIPAKANKILAVGRLDAWYVKGFDILIKAWGNIANNHPDWILEIVGGGSQESLGILKLLAKKSGVETRIRFLPFQEDPRPVYLESSIFCLSSRYEGFGMALIEAMSQACACVSCDYKGRQREIITGEEYGIICSPDNVGELSSALSRMIDDSEYRKCIQYNSPKRAAHFKLGYIMEKWNYILNSIQ